jgi:hypothetical protein
VRLDARVGIETNRDDIGASASELIGILGVVARDDSGSLVPKIEVIDSVVYRRLSTMMVT